MIYLSGRAERATTATGNAATADDEPQPAPRAIPENRVAAGRIILLNRQFVSQ